jgi:hypothetical protein
MGAVLRSATLGPWGRTALKRQQCFVAALLNSDGVWGNEKYRGKFGHFKTDKSKVL